MAEVKTLTARDLAEKAGISPAGLRKILRSEFNRAGKTKVEDNRMEYRFDPNDPIVKQIIDRIKSLQREKSKSRNPEPKQHNGQETSI